eukprot:scaffold63098_cov48-Phaeocystis_antarctica.AAC.1
MPSMTSLVGCRTATSAMHSRERPSIDAVIASARSSRPERASSSSSDSSCSTEPTPRPSSSRGSTWR